MKKEEFEKKEEELNSSIKKIRESHEDMAFEFQYGIKRLNRYLELEYLAEKDRLFFQEQIDSIKEIQRKEDEKYEELDNSLTKQKRKLYDDYELEKQEEEGEIEGD